MEDSSVPTYAAPVLQLFFPSNNLCVQLPLVRNMMATVRVVLSKKVVAIVPQSPFVSMEQSTGQRMAPAM